MYISCTFLLTLKMFVILAVTFRGHSSSSAMSPFDRPHTSSYWRSTVTMACIVSEIKRDICRKSRILVENAALEGRAVGI